MRLRHFIAGGLVAASALIVPLSSAAHASDVNDIKIGNHSQFVQTSARPQTLVFKISRFQISGR
jgi:hypothetical protein